MELVFVYVEEYRVLEKIPVTLHPLFDVSFINKKITITLKDKSFLDYYNNVKVKAVIGKNGSGKSTLLEFIEESFSYTESRGLIIWYSKSDNFFYIQCINLMLEVFNFDLCYPSIPLIIDKSTLRKMKHSIVKINNLGGDLLQSASKRNSSIIDLSLGRQNKLSGNKRNSNLLNLITFFNESSWLNNKNSRYEYHFKFKNPSSTVQGWIFNLYCKARPKENKDFLKYEFIRKADFIFHPFPLINNDINSRYDISSGLLIRNIFSLIKAMSTSGIVGTDFTDKLAIEVFNNILMNHLPLQHEIITIVERVYTDWLKEHKANINTTDFDCSILINNLLHSFQTLDEIAEIIYSSLNDPLDQIDSNDLLISDYTLILNLIDTTTRLPKSISNNFSYGWTGFSTGELAKLNIFASIYNYLKNSKSRTHLFIIDEVDLYLHPEWQRTFMSELLSFLSDGIDKDSIQLILTTHSPLIIGDFLSADIISLQSDKYGKVFIGESLGFGTEITDAYTAGMHITSTFGELSRIKLLGLIDRKAKGELTQRDLEFSQLITNSSIREILLND